MLCQSCQHNNPDDNRFCGKCGALLSAQPDAPSQAQSTVDYLQRVAHEHPRGERPENPPTPEGSYETQQPVPRAADLEQERERARNVYQYRDSHPNVRLKGYPREGYDEGDQPVVELQPELIEFDNKIPLIASPGMDRRKPEWRFRDTREKPLLEPKAEGELRQQAQPRETSPEQERTSAPEITTVRTVDSQPTQREAPTPVAPRSTPTASYRSNSIFGLNDAFEGPPENQVAKVSQSGVRESARETQLPEYAVASEDISTEPPIRGEAPYENKFLDFSDSAQDDRTSLHGPSFLGLDSSPMEYVDEDNSGSHARRNLALVLLLILAGLAALQWRSIRDFSVRYAGIMHIPGRGGQPLQATPAPEPSQAPQATQPASDGKPEMIAEAPKNPNAQAPNAAAPNAQNSGATNTPPPNPGENSASNAANPVANAAASPGPATPNQGTLSASNRDSSRLPQGEPANADDGANDDSADNETQTSSARRNSAQPKDAARPDPGQAELAQASAAPDPETASAWLWRAVGKGSPEAQVRLADMYTDGRGVPQNCEQALILLKSAANKNFARARIRLGSLYATGKCVQQDRVAAYQWMSRALDSSPGSQWVEENRQMLWTQMSEDEKRRASGKM